MSTYLIIDKFNINNIFGINHNSEWVRLCFRNRIGIEYGKHVNT